MTKNDDASKLTLAPNDAHLKRYERVVSNLLLARIEPSFTHLPDALDSPELEEVLQHLKTNKKHQVASLLRCILPLLKHTSTVIDFGGGSGHLSIPLARLRPDCTVVCVDLDRRRLEQLHETSARLSGYPKGAIKPGYTYQPPTSMEYDCRRQKTAIHNLYTFHGPVHRFDDPFHVGVALHLCGEATDVVFRVAGKAGAAAIVAAPCCVGKTSGRASDPHVYKATGQNRLTIQYPQSSAFCQVIQSEDDWNSLAKAADFSDSSQIRTARNSVRRTAKAMLETDRRLYLEETFGYITTLSRIEPWEASPKNDVLIAWDPLQYGDDSPGINVERVNDECLADVSYSKGLLLSPSNDAPYKRDLKGTDEEEIRQVLQDVLATHSRTPHVFQTASMSSRRRKLIHNVAEDLGLKHWSTDSDQGRTVAVVPYLVPPDKLRDFKANGAVVLRNVLTPSEILLLEKGVEYNLSNPSSLAGVASKDSDPGRFFEDFCNWTRIKEFEAIMTESFLPLVAARLMKSETVRIYHDHLLVKEALTVQPTPFHQDIPYYNIRGSQTVSFWIPVDPVPKASSLQCVPGSHASGTWYMPRTFLTHEAKWFPEGSLPDVPDPESFDDLLSWDLEPGDIVAFDMRTIHGSQGSAGRRRVFSARYIGDDVTHAPRSWKTSPEFPSSVKELVAKGQPFDHTLFPIVYETKTRSRRPYFA